MATDVSALTVVERTRDAIATLGGGNVVLGTGVIDYAVAEMLAVLVDLHGLTGIDLEALPEVGCVAHLIVHGWDQ